MRFTLFEPTALSPHHLLQLAQAAEASGFDSFSLNDGTFQMRDTRGVYPYAADNRPNWDLEAPFYEPMTVLPALGMQTERIQLLTNVLKLPLHHPLILAKQIATAAVMSNDRFTLGVGASWAPEEYEYCGVDWSKRGQIMTESIEVLRLVLSGQMVEYHGEIFDFQPLVARPAPRKPVKIIFGGHHEPSLKRAARLGNGWTAVPRSTDELIPVIKRLRELCDQYERDWASFEIHARAPDAFTLDDYRRLAEMGVTDATILPMDLRHPDTCDPSAVQRLRGEKVLAAESSENIYSREPPTHKLNAVHRFADTVISRWTT